MANKHQFCQHKLTPKTVTQSELSEKQLKRLAQHAAGLALIWNVSLLNGIYSFFTHIVVH